MVIVVGNTQSITVQSGHMKDLLLVIMVGLLVGCGKKPTEQSVSDQERPDVTNPSKPPAKTEAQIEAEKKAFAETKGKAESGNAAAQYNLGVSYEEGEGVAKDDKEAVKWYRLAAGQGDGYAQYNIEVLYAQGQGVLEDYVTSYAWLNIAAANGIRIAKKNKPVIAKLLAPEQIAKARELSREMVKKNPKLINK